MKRWKRLAAGAMAFVLTSSGGTGILGEGIKEVRADNCGGLLEEDVYTPDEDEVIQDPILHWAVRSAMNAVKSGVKLTKEMVGDESVKYISYELCNHPEDFEGWTHPYWVESLEGLQYATSAEMIDICYTANIEGKRIASVEPLAPLAQLEILYLKQNGISDISPLKELINLRQLDVSGNYEIKDISSVTDMDKLETLDISINSVSDLSPVAGLESLERMNASSNQLTWLPDMSGMTSLKALDLSKNQLTDVSALAGLSGLQELNLSGNDSLTDVRTLSGLTGLKKEATYMPTEQMKEDLFAAIDVNKLFLVFNISKMTVKDIPAVESALEAYRKLTDEQKTYIDSKMVEAATTNKELVEQGSAPVYYPEYDQGGEPVPVFDRITIQAVDKNGSPMSDVEFIREEVGGWGVPSVQKTDKNGMIVYQHSSLDRWATFEIYPAGDIYVSSPEKITYFVDENGQTGEVNGKPATGLEELVFTLIPTEQYVDKSALEAAISQYGGIEPTEAYKYTEDTWNIYEQALLTAKTVYDNTDASDEDVAQAVEALKKGYEGLTKAEFLTKLKITVKDSNGNLFTRPFKFQVRERTNHASAWNIESDGRTGIVYLSCSPAWYDGMEWEILACEEEPYSFDSIYTVIGARDGKTYFKTVNGQEQGADFAAEVTLSYENKPTAIRQADNTVLQEYIANADVYEENNYTPGTWEAFRSALDAAKNAVGQTGASQEDYNQAAADLLKAEAGLSEKADKTRLGKELNDSWYTEILYTPGSWKNYIDTRKQAQQVYDDPEAKQKQVDDAADALAKAKMDLIFVASKDELRKKLDEAGQLKAEDYTEGWDALQSVLKEAQKVYDDPEATQAQVDEQTEAVSQAIDELVEKPVELPDTCSEGIFRAVVQDENGTPISGITFDIIRDGAETGETLVSEQGIISQYLYPADYGKKIDIRLQSGQGYTTDDMHSFTVNGGSQWIPLIDTIDGKPYMPGMRLVYTLKAEQQEVPVLSDENTFRARVVDEEGKAVSGAVFAFVSNDPWVGPYEAVSSENGILEMKVDPMDYLLKFTVTLKEGQESWTSADTHTFETGGGPVSGAPIESIDGKPISEAGEIVFVLKAEETPGTEINTEALRNKIAEAQGFNAEEYTEESYRKLQEAIVAAQAVLDDPKSQSEVDSQTEELEKAIQGLEKKSEQPGDQVLSDETTFRARVTDEEGNPVKGAGFDFTSDNTWGNSYEGVSGEDGVLELKLGIWDYGQTYTVSLKDGQTSDTGEEWTCIETHSFKTEGAWDTAAYIVEIDGKPLAESGEITFVLKKEEPSQSEVNKEELAAWLGSAATYLESDYTPESYVSLKEAVAEGERIMDDADATQQDVDDACTAIEEAISGLEKADLPVYCDKNNVRIKVIYEDGTRVENGVEFVIDRDYGKYNSTTFDGQISYALSTSDSGMQMMSVYLRNGVTVIDGKEYIADPQQFTFTFKQVDTSVEIDTIDGEPFTGTTELVFTLKEKAEGPEINKDELNQIISEAEAKLAEKDIYTINSINALQSALEEAKKVAIDENVSQVDVDNAKTVLRGAIDGLKEIQGMQTLVIPVTMQDGSSAENIEFVRRYEEYGVNQKLFANEGKLEWTPGTYDRGEFSFYLPETSAYIATPERIYVQVGDEDGTSVIESINGMPAAQAQAAFMLTRKGTDTCDMLTFRAIVQDIHGNLLPGVRFDVENGDPTELVSDENGVIVYSVTGWDIGDTMTVRVQDGQGWISDRQVSFAVIDDPNDPGRGIIGFIDGAPAVGGEKVLFQLRNENEQVVDFSGLSTVMEEAARLDASKYTEESFAAVTEALEEAKLVLGNGDATQAEVDSAVQKLRSAIDGLAEKPKDPDSEPSDPVPPEDRPTDSAKPGTDSGDGQISVGQNGQGNAEIRNTSVKAVRTGDNAAVGIWAAAGVLALAAGIVTAYRRKVK